MDDRGITVNSGPFYFSIRIGDRRYMRKVMFIK
jgi:hypothetical protein